MKALARSDRHQRHVSAIVQGASGPASSAIPTTGCSPAVRGCGLSAEAIRDQALAVSGLLVERIGGPSVHPYQPPGLWKELTGGGDFVQDHGADLYRRSLYTFWKRTIAPPSMITFDAAGREACTVRSGTDQHAAASACAAERNHVRRGGPRAGPAGDARRRRTRRPNGSRWSFAWPWRDRPATGELTVLLRRLSSGNWHVFEQPARGRGRNLLAVGESPARRAAATRRTGGLDDGGQPDFESGRSRYQGVTQAMDPRTHHRWLVSRRSFFRSRPPDWAAWPWPRCWAKARAATRPHGRRSPGLAALRARGPSGSSTCFSRAPRRRWTCSTTSRNWPNCHGNDCPTRCGRASG